MKGQSEVNRNLTINVAGSATWRASWTTTKQGTYLISNTIHKNQINIIYYKEWELKLYE